MNSSSFPGELRVPDPDPVVAYVDSMRGFYAALPHNMTWDDVLGETARLTSSEIEANGFFLATAQVGCFICH